MTRWLATYELERVADRNPLEVHLDLPTLTVSVEALSPGDAVVASLEAVGALVGAHEGWRLLRMERA